MDTSYPVFPIFAFLSFILVLIPLPWHLHAWNSGTCLFMIWTAIACLIQFINSIIWHGNIVDWAPIWCDISTRLAVGITVATPAACLCISRRLYMIATCQNATIDRSQKRRAIIVDLGIGLGIPALQMPLQFIVQGHRYDIWEDVGCLYTTVNTPPAYPLTFLWPNIISLISAVYGILTLKAFLRRRAVFSQIALSNSSLSANRYFRLMCLSMVDIVFTIPLSTYGLYLNAVSESIYPWRSWSDIHYDWYLINVIPVSIWRSDPQLEITIELNRWSPILCAVFFFAFFGFAEEARKNYRTAYHSLFRLFGLPRGSNQFKISLKDSGTPLPVYAPKTQIPSPLKRDSFHSNTSQDSGLTSSTIIISVPPSKTKVFDINLPTNSKRVTI